VNLLFEPNSNKEKKKTEEREDSTCDIPIFCVSPFLSFIWFTQNRIKTDAMVVRGLCGGPFFCVCGFFPVKLRQAVFEFLDLKCAVDFAPG
jgi:hypothetical protein